MREFSNLTQTRHAIPVERLGRRRCIDGHELNESVLGAKIVVNTFQFDRIKRLEKYRVGFSSIAVFMQNFEDNSYDLQYNEMPDFLSPGKFQLSVPDHKLNDRFCLVYRYFQMISPFLIGN